MIRHAGYGFVTFDEPKGVHNKHYKHTDCTGTTFYGITFDIQPSKVSKAAFAGLLLLCYLF